MKSPPRIDFYLLKNHSPNGRFRLACRIVEKAYLKNNNIYLLTKNVEDSDILNDLLWTFSQSSFVPHQLEIAGKNIKCPVIIGMESAKKNDIDVLVSVADDPIKDFNVHPRIAEIVGFEKNEKELARNRFRYYRENGINPNTYHINLKA